MSSLNRRGSSYPEASLTLVVSAAEGRLLLALGRREPCGEGEELLFAQEWQATAQGVELLTPALDGALRALKLTPRQIGRIAAVNGPGSFTGLRLSIVSAAGLARAVRAEQAGIPYLPLLAAYAAQLWRELEPQESGQPEFWALTHARRALVHVQGFAPEGRGLAPVSDILVLGLEEAAALLAGRETGGRAACSRLVFGTGLGRNREFFAAALAGQPVRLLGSSFELPSPAFLLKTALQAEYGAADIAPLYVRQSEAEENLPQISARLGLDPAGAEAALRDILSAPPKNQA